MSQTFSINIDQLSCRIITQDFLQSSQKKTNTKQSLLQLEVKPRIIRQFSSLLCPQEFEGGREGEREREREDQALPSTLHPVKWARQCNNVLQIINTFHCHLHLVKCVKYCKVECQIAVKCFRSVLFVSGRNVVLPEAYTKENTGYCIISQHGLEKCHSPDSLTFLSHKGKRGENKGVLSSSKSTDLLFPSTLRDAGTDCTNSQLKHI